MGTIRISESTHHVACSVSQMAMQMNPEEANSAIQMLQSQKASSEHEIHQLRAESSDELQKLRDQVDELEVALSLSHSLTKKKAPSNPKAALGMPMKSGAKSFEQQMVELQSQIALLMSTMKGDKQERMGLSRN